MARHADHLAEITHAAVDRGHHTERQVERVEHRALLDVHLDEAHVARGIALACGDRRQRGRQAGALHRLAHGDAVGVSLVEPRAVEMTGQRSRTEKGRLVALAFFFGEADDLDGVWQALARALQFAHADHRHEDAEPPVVLAGVAHGVVVRAGEQARALVFSGVMHAAVGAEIDADDVADGVDAHLVEAAVAHPRRELRGAGAVRVGQVGDGELAAVAALAVTRVGVRGQQLGAVPGLVAERRQGTELVIEPDLGDAVDVADALGELEFRVVAEAPLEATDDLVAVQPAAARPAHRKRKRPTKLRVVGRVQRLDVCELGRRAVGQARLTLLVRRLGRQRLAHHGLACQFGVGADQRDLRLAARVTQHRDQRVLELRERGERSFGGGLFGDPRRVLIDAVECGGQFGGRGRVESIECQRRWHRKAPEVGVQ